LRDPRQRRSGDRRGRRGTRVLVADVERRRELDLRATRGHLLRGRDAVRRRDGRRELRPRARNPRIPAALRRAIRDQPGGRGRRQDRAVRAPRAVRSVPRPPRRTAGGDRAGDVGDGTVHGRPRRPRAGRIDHPPAERGVLAPHLRRPDSPVPGRSRAPSGPRRTLLFLLYVLGAQRGLEGAIWASCFLLIISVACWMKGAFVLPTASIAKRSVVLVLMLVLVLGSGMYFVVGKFRSTNVGLADSRLPGNWQAFTPERLQAELEQGHTVFVDFTAAWCLTCKFNEANVLEAQDVKDAFQRHGIVKLKADWTNGDPAITKLLRQFGRPGVPLYVLYPANNEEPIVFPELLTKSMLLDKLETVAGRVASQY